MQIHPNIVDRLRPTASREIVDQLRVIARKQLTPAMRESLDVLMGDAVAATLFTPSTRIKDAHAKIRLVQSIMEDPNLSGIRGLSSQLPGILMDIAVEIKGFGTAETRGFTGFEEGRL